MTIPRALREQFGLKPESEVTCEAADGGVLIKPMDNERLARMSGEERLRQLEVAMHLSRGSANGGLTTDEVMQLTRGED